MTKTVSKPTTHRTSCGDRKPGYATYEGIGSRTCGVITSGGTTYYVHDSDDPRGSVIKQTNAAGDVIRHTEYNAFGQILGQSTSGPDLPNRFGYQSNWITLKDSPDERLKLSPTRTYDADLGQFGQRDALFGLGGNYTYCRSAPVLVVDPMGLKEYFLIAIGPDVKIEKNVGGKSMLMWAANSEASAAVLGKFSQWVNESKGARGKAEILPILKNASLREVAEFASRANLQDGDNLHIFLWVHGRSAEPVIYNPEDEQRPRVPVPLQIQVRHLQQWQNWAGQFRTAEEIGKSKYRHRVKDRDMRKIPAGSVLRVGDLAKLREDVRLHVFPAGWGTGYPRVTLDFAKPGNDDPVTPTLSEVCQDLGGDLDRPAQVTLRLWSCYSGFARNDPAYQNNPFKKVWAYNIDTELLTDTILKDMQFKILDVLTSKGWLPKKKARWYDRKIRKTTKGEPLVRDSAMVFDIVRKPSPYGKKQKR